MLGNSQHASQSLSSLDRLHLSLGPQFYATIHMYAVALRDSR